MKDYRFLQKKYVVPSYANRGLTLVRGEGVYLFDDKGKKYLDLMSNYGASIFGYGNSSFVDSAVRQLKKLPNLHGSFVNDARAEASAKLVRRCGLNYKKVYWSNSGSEAVEAALKFAVFATGKRKFIAAKNSFHGKTLGALSATGMRKYRQKLEPLLTNFSFVDYNDIAQLRKAADRQTAAVILEPIQGEGGVVMPNKSYIGKAEKICKSSGCLLILDEVQTGVGRTGKFLASRSDGVDADIICLGKGLAGGLAVGATVVTDEVAESVLKSSHSSTIGGNPLVCAAVLTVLETLDEKTLKIIKGNGSYFLRKLRAVRSDKISGVRGKGLIIGVEVKNSRDRILKNLQENGILAIPAGDDVVRFLPLILLVKGK